MESKILMLILLSQFYIGISTDFPWLIKSCLEKLVKSDAKTAAASTNVIIKCFSESGANVTDWDHPWIVSLYRSIFEAILCEEEQDGCPVERRVRREYRLLSDDERREYHKSIVNLYNDTVCMHFWFTFRFGNGFWSQNYLTIFVCQESTWVSCLRLIFSS